MFHIFYRRATLSGVVLIGSSISAYQQLRAHDLAMSTVNLLIVAAMVPDVFSLAHHDRGYYSSRVLAAIIALGLLVQVMIYNPFRLAFGPLAAAIVVIPVMLYLVGVAFWGDG